MPSPPPVQKLRGSYRHDEATITYWSKLRPEVTSNGLFVDSTALLDAHDAKYQDSIVDFLQREASNSRFFTSTYCVTETCRRLIKRTARYPFAGPNGEQEFDLALHVLQAWMDQFKIKTVCVPECVFNVARTNLARRRQIEGWDLTDEISLTIIQGLGRLEVVSHDSGFRNHGVTLLPYGAGRKGDD